MAIELKKSESFSHPKMSTVKSAVFQHRNIRKFTSTSLDGKTQSH